MCIICIVLDQQLCVCVCTQRKGGGGEGFIGKAQPNKLVFNLAETTSFIVLVSISAEIIY